MRQHLFRRNYASRSIVGICLVDYKYRIAKFLCHRHYPCRRDYLSGGIIRVANPDHIGFRTYFADISKEFYLMSIQATGILIFSKGGSKNRRLAFIAKVGEKIDGFGGAVGDHHIPLANRKQVAQPFFKTEGLRLRISADFIAHTCEYLHQFRVIPP